MGEAQPGNQSIAPPAQDRPDGQADPQQSAQRRSVRRGVVLTALGVFGVGILAWAIVASTIPTSPAGPLSLIALLFAFTALNNFVHLQFAYKQELSFDIPLLMCATVLLPPVWAVAAVACGYFLGYCLRFRGDLDLDLPFNVGVNTIAISLAGMLLWAVGWDWSEGHSAARLAFAALACGLVQIAFMRMCDAIIIHQQAGHPIRQLLRDNTIGMQEAEQAMLIAMLSLGTIGIIAAESASWTLLLLLAPAFALWHALRQHIQTRHRIEASLETAQQVARIGTLDWDLRNRDMRWSGILYQILAYDADQHTATFDAYLDRVAPSDRTAVATAFSSASTGIETEIEHRVDLPTGNQRSLNVTVRAVLDRHKRVKRLVATVHDVTDRKLLEDRLQFQAFHDPLTGLANRAMFLNRLDQSFARYGRDESIALLFLDLDRFKLINDTFGHEAGDHLLRTVARRLEQCVRPNDLVARLGGDEFIILLDAVHTTDEAIAVADRILHDFERPVPLGAGRDVHAATSIGIVRPTAEHLTAADFLRDADTALYAAKEHGRGRYAIFAANMSADGRNRLELEDDLREAFAQHQFSIVYQPRYDLGTGEVTMLEALLRWRHPRRGPVPPRAFLPIVEDLGLADAMLDVTLAAVLGDLATWHKLPTPVPTVSLNLSPRQALTDSLPERLLNAVRVQDLPANALRVEVPEAAMTENEPMMIRVIGQLRAAGIRTSLDDFGTGHATLTALSRVPIDMLQLDHSLVADLGASERARTIAQAVIAMAHGLG
ncbi:MAG TPA: EAL domain-containing protein, partial [Thermomicrobiales bacterium]|nr:EAL domain-containing protein [Thermomicrobiales bacterium]